MVDLSCRHPPLYWHITNCGDARYPRPEIHFAGLKHYGPSLTLLFIAEFAVSTGWLNLLSVTLPESYCCSQIDLLNLYSLAFN